MAKIIVSVVPGDTVEVSCDVNATVRQVLLQANISLDNSDIHLNGEEVDLDATVRDQDDLSVSQRVKGNAVMKVLVGKIPGELKEVLLPKDNCYNVEEVAIMAGMREEDIARMSPSINSNGCDLGDEVKNDDEITFAQPVKGNK